MWWYRSYFQQSNDNQSASSPKINAQEMVLQLFEMNDFIIPQKLTDPEQNTEQSTT